jgi:membrane-bound lytic murein transglycosylase D
MPSATVTAAKDAEWLRSLALPDFPIRLDPLVVEYLRFYRDTEQGRAIAQVWARKVGRYSASMQEELAKAGLPRDLVWLSLIESGHNPTIVSPAGAAGMWQFIPDSARIYGLTVDRWVDERLDPARASQAASRFLADLYTRFGTWEMAMAAYNMGHAGLLKTVRKYNTNDYWKLVHYEAALPWETILYVPKVFAIAIVMNNRRAFNLQDIEPDPAITFDTVYVAAGTPIGDVAKASGVALDSLRSMNPEYLNERLPLAAPQGEKDTKAASRWPLRLPRGVGAKTTRALMPPPKRTSYDAYTVRFGDTLETVSVQFQTTVPKLAALNVILESTSLMPGGVIMVPRVFAGSPTPVVEGEFIVVPRSNKSVPGRNRVFYRVLRLDTLASVANAFDVTADELVVWNDLDVRSKLQSGMTLQVFVPPQADLSRVRAMGPRDARLLEVGSAEFLTYFEALNGRKRVSVKALKGDTLEKIGKRHGLSVGMMERINRCSRNRVLKLGEEVIVYSKTEPKGGVKDAPDTVKVSLGNQTLKGRPLAQAVAPRPDLLP